MKTPSISLLTMRETTTTDAVAEFATRMLTNTAMLLKGSRRTASERDNQASMMLPASVGASTAIHQLRSSVERADNDARWLREKQGEEHLLAEVIRQAAERFRGGVTHLQQP